MDEEILTKNKQYELFYLKICTKTFHAVSMNNGCAEMLNIMKRNSQIVSFGVGKGFKY